MNTLHWVRASGNARLSTLLLVLALPSSPLVAQTAPQRSDELADFAAGAEAYRSGDYATALKEFLPLATQGNPAAQFNVGLMYERGQGVPQNRQEAFTWYRLAADQGNASAQFFLGTDYQLGQGVPEDHKEAVKWFRLAADQGLAGAQYSLGFEYERGYAVSQDYKESVRWYRLAADQGLVGAQRSLGVMYDEGKGVPQDYVQAHMWYNLAGANGDADGVKNRDIVARKMTPDQIAEAQRLAREWKPKASR
jgi:uncharacterized protein